MSHKSWELQIHLVKLLEASCAHSSKKSAQPGSLPKAKTLLESFALHKSLLDSPVLWYCILFLRLLGDSGPHPQMEERIVQSLGGEASGESGRGCGDQTGAYTPKTQTWMSWPISFRRPSRQTKQVVPWSVLR